VPIAILMYGVVTECYTVASVATRGFGARG
jgi:hypothetical protein